MSNKTQTTKNIHLTNKLLNYLTSEDFKFDLPKNVSFIPFSKSDEKLNKANEKLLESLIDGDKPIVKAVEPKNKKIDWVITPVNF